MDLLRKKYSRKEKLIDEFTGKQEQTKYIRTKQNLYNVSMK